MMDARSLLQAAQGFFPWLSDTYRDFHRYPETAHHEIETNRRIRAQLDALHVSYLMPAENITIAVLDSGKPGPCVGLRCDTDALPVQEDTGLPYASAHDGVMHACGHDAHITIGLGAARLLSARSQDWRGRVKIIFQPAEEGENGADEVIATGLVDDVDAFFAIHAWSPYPTGTIHLSPITVAAAVDMFTIRITGQGGHGATPEKCRDALVAGAALVNALQTVVSRSVSPMVPAVLTIGSFHAGTVGNIIAQEAELRGTLRALDNETAAHLRAEMARIAEQTAQAFGCTANIFYHCRQDAVVNDAGLCETALSCAADLLPADKIGPQAPMMLGDDFSAYRRIAPACYAHVGIADEALQTCAAHHNGKFRVDESVLPLCAAWMAAFVDAVGRNK